SCAEGETLLEALQSLRLDLFTLYQEEDNEQAKKEMPAPTTLAQDLRSGTAKVHAIAERSAFIKHYMRGELNREIYGQFLISLYHIYIALEEVLDQHANNERLRTIYFPDKLRRAPEIEKDLEFYIGPTWREKAQQVPQSTQDYVDRLYELSRTNPDLLVAHSYTRYLGDLSGGQILAKRTRKFLELPADKGTAFYDFDAIDNCNEFKEDFRAALNEIPVDADTKAAIVEEANNAFRLNVGVFEAHEHLLQQG
ncbi:hypothetical protein THASP1DRAFT_11819, partial [Thamnocephalis sphaerospora]